MCRSAAAFATLALVVATPLGGAAQAEQPSDDARVALRSSLKTSVLASRLPDDPLLFPDRQTAAGFWRVRFEPTVRVNDTSTVEVAFEQRLHVLSSTSGAVGAGVLPTEADPPFRVRPLDWQVSSSDRTEWRAEIDRAAFHVRAGSTEFVVGRQAIGWGRGVLFSAVDLFAPFTPLEADREWRRGVDAMRADVKLSDRASVDAVGAFGTNMDHSVFAARLRGYAERADVEVVGGRRARDLFGGLTSSAALGDAEVHAELAVFRTPAVANSASSGSDRSVVKAVAGGSYRFALGNGVLVYGEYHYSGFGAPSADGIQSLLADPAFGERYLRGDTQILGRHAIAVLALYELSPIVSYSIQWLQSPVDGSGVLVPSSTFTLSDRVSMLLSGYVPFGATPTGPTLQSDFGASPLAALLQLRIYR